MKKTVDLGHIAYDIEMEASQMDLAVAVLKEVANYFIPADAQKLLPHYADHVLNLLYAALTLLNAGEENLRMAVDRLYEKSSEEKKDGEIC